jgi:hypothetical protein
MKTFATALIGLSFIIGTVMAQTPAASSSTTDTTKTASKVKKHKKHTAPATTPAPAASSTPAK